MMAWHRVSPRSHTEVTAVSIPFESLPPVVAEISAPAATVFDLLALELTFPGVQPSPQKAEGGRLALVELAAPARWRSTELVIAEPPSLVTYRMQEGPC